jgi:stage V sporulation protein D (sporulation-specific penicillin-binding protein)
VTENTDNISKTPNRPDTKRTGNRRRKMRKESPLSGKRRGWILFIGFCMSLFCVYLVYSLYDIQVNQYEYYSKMASQQHWRRIKDMPVRGDILDANGNILAGTTYVYTVGMTPLDVRSLTKTMESQEIADNVAIILGLEVTDVMDALSQTDATYVQLAKGLSKDQINLLATYITDNNIGGIKIDPVEKRFYTNGDLASQVIGFAQAYDGTLVGQLGIEYYYNQALTGKEGYTYVEVDNYSQSALPYSAPTTIEAEDGYNVVLNVDENIQQIATDACADVYEIYDVIDGVTAIVMDPYTGAVMAMVSYPGFDANNPREMPFWLDGSTWTSMTNEEQTTYLMSESWRNRVISDTYEPGSTFKAFTTAIALEEGLTYEEEVFSDEPIEISTIDTISCWREDEGGNHGWESLRQAFQNSCNPIFVQLAERIGIRRYYEYIHNFGFYTTTGIDLPAEGVGIFHQEPSVVDLAALSYGESSTVTPLQLANVYSALVNGGKLMTPQIAKALTDQDGNIVKEFDPQVIRTIFSEKTADRIKTLMESVVTEGTGTAGYVEGYKVAGKTSTSTIENGEYAGLHVLSFGCYAPSDDPQIVVLVVVNMPKDKEVGSSCATKTAAIIVSKTLEYLNVKHQYSDNDYIRLSLRYAIPDVTGMTYKDAKKVLYESGFTVADGESDMMDDTIITVTYPGIDKTLYKNGLIVLYSGATMQASDSTDTDQQAINTAGMKQVVIPDFTGKDISECIREARISGVNLDFRGNIRGAAISQDPAPSSTTPEPSISPTVTPTVTGALSDNTDNGAPASEPITTPGETSPVRTQIPMGTIIIIEME